MRFILLLAMATLLPAQPQDLAYEPLTRAFEALRARDYDTAIVFFRKAVDAAPTRSAIRKDIAYTYLRIGENAAAISEFREAVRLDPGDTQVALEYAFLIYEAKEQAQARRIFDRIRQTGNPVAEQAFRNIDAPLAAGIERWKAAIAAGTDDFSAHFELASLAEQRDELTLAAEHYERAWRLLPDRRSVLVDLGRVWKAMGRGNDATAALLAASRGGEPRAADLARELLPARYPFVDEFRLALKLDPTNVELRRELGYLLLQMEEKPDAEREFQAVADVATGDLLSAAQLGFLLYVRGEHAAAQLYFDRVLAGNDDDLANRVRAVLRIPQVLSRRAEAAPASIDAKVMAERSIKAGYTKDALKYLQMAHEADPADFDVMLKLGWTFNILHNDHEAFRWFDLARKAPDPRLATEAQRAWRNLRSANARFRIAAWLFPVYSTRWQDLFSYGQVRLGVRMPIALHPYLSVRFAGDTRLTIGAVSPQYLSESSFIFAAGVTTNTWHGAVAWGEAGTAVSYVHHRMLPDYRGGISFARAIGRPLGAESSGPFAAATVDAVFVSRFGNDFLVYDQTRFGYTLRMLQLYWNANVTFDVRSQTWANFAETGPGLRVALPFASYLTVDYLRGARLRDPSTYSDFRAGIWYAFTR